MKIRVLGCSGGIGAGLQSTSFLVDDDVLIDAGTGVNTLTMDEMARIRHIFLTHTHLDHIACLPLMVDSIFSRIEEPIVIHAQTRTIEVLREHVFNWSIWPDFTTLPNHARPVMRYCPLDGGQSREIGGRRFEAIAVNHIVPTVGYRVSCASGSFAFSGDTTSNTGFWSALNAHDGLDLLFVEVAFSDEQEELSLKARHYCPKRLAADIRRLRHRPRIFLTHNKPGAEGRILDQCRVAITDRKIESLTGGMSFEI